MSLYLILRVSAVILLSSLELLFTPETRPELSFGLCLYFTFTLYSEEPLYLFLIAGTLKDSLSVERFGLFIAISAALFILSRTLSQFFSPTLPVLCITYLLSSLLIRLMYGLHIILDGYSPEGILNIEAMLPALSQGLALLIPLYMLLEECRLEKKKREIYSEEHLG
ncbi:MAG: hypothetical protein N2234_05880 [Planctomycetota bacterium]|nr:hypothetical protein [Planctomycetota bacterium]